MVNPSESAPSRESVIQSLHEDFGMYAQLIAYEPIENDNWPLTREDAEGLGRRYGNFEVNLDRVLKESVLEEAEKEVIKAMLIGGYMVGMCHYGAPEIESFTRLGSKSAENLRSLWTSFTDEEDTKYAGVLAEIVAAEEAYLQTPGNNIRRVVSTDAQGNNVESQEEVRITEVGYAGQIALEAMV
jgi:hypothetical protein